MSEVGGFTQDTYKNVLVKPAGTPGVDCDFTTINDAALFLQSWPGDEGGVITLEGGATHNVNTVVDLTGIQLQSSSTTVAIVNAQNSGRLIVNGTRWASCQFVVPAGFTNDLGGSYILDANANGFIRFTFCDFAPAAGEFIIGNSVGNTALLVLAEISGQSDAGLFVDTAAVFSTLQIAVRSTNTNLNKIECGARAVIVDPDGRMDTTSTGIVGVPPNTLVVAPGENIQSRIDSISAAGGGVVRLTPGTHDITAGLVVPSDVVLCGSGPDTVIRAQVATWTDGVTATDAVIHVGTGDGNTPASNAEVSNLRIDCEPRVHGIYVAGGQNIIVEKCTCVPTAAIQTRCGILFTNGNGSAGRKFFCFNNRIFSEDPGNDYWTDGIHMDGGLVTGFTGIFGFGSNDGIFDSFCSFNVVEHMEETVLLFTRVFDSSIFVNRTRTCPYSATGIVCGLLVCDEADFQGNTLIDNPSGGAPEVCYIYDAKRCKVIDNTVDGNQTAGGAFNRVWWLTGSGGGGRSDECIISRNVIRNASIGVRADNGSRLNTIGDNDFTSVTTPYSDANAGANTNIYEGARQSNAAPGFTDIFHRLVHVGGTGAGLEIYKQMAYPQGNTWVRTFFRPHYSSLLIRVATCPGGLTSLNCGPCDANYTIINNTNLSVASLAAGVSGSPGFAPTTTLLLGTIAPQVGGVYRVTAHLSAALATALADLFMRFNDGIAPTNLETRFTYDNLNDFKVLSLSGFVNIGAGQTTFIELSASVANQVDISFFQFNLERIE